MTTYHGESMGTHGATWQAAGYAGAGNVAPLLGTGAGRPAIVCGNGAGVFAELAEAQARLVEPVILAANDVGMYLPVLHHWVTLHGDNLGAWKTVRWLHHRAQEQTCYHTPDPRPFSDYVWEGLRPIFCLSGYFAMQVAWLLGCRPIVLCGCPGEQVRRFFESTARAEFGYGNGPVGSDKGVREQLEKEMMRLPEFKAAVRSMGGWTKSYFGSLED